MNKENLVILNNEKVFKENGNFFLDNLDLKVIPEGLNQFFNVKFIVRKSKKKGEQNINLKNIDIASNIFSFIFFVIKSFKDNSKYLIISITPYTFLAYIFLFIFRKKVYLYLWSDGHEEWEHILGKWSVWIFSVMYHICTFRSEIIVCNKRLTKKKSHLISISRLENKWFQNLTKASTKNVDFLYVGRLSKEKGIFDLINMINENNYSSEDCIGIVRIFLIKAKRILHLKKMNEINNNIEKTISDYKPPIFWKDKNVVIEQLKSWSIDSIESFIFKINELELSIKKNTNLSVNILKDFILSQFETSN